MTWYVQIPILTRYIALKHLDVFSTTHFISLCENAASPSLLDGIDVSTIVHIVATQIFVLTPIFLTFGPLNL